MLKIIKKTFSAIRVFAGLALLGIWIGSGFAFAEPASPPLALTNQDVGLTAAEIEANQPPLNPTAPVTTAPTPATPSDQAAQLRAAANEAQMRAQVAAREAKVATAAAEAAAAGQIPGVGTNQDGPPRYESCVEASIRRGLSLNGSDRLCRAVFPKSTEAPETTGDDTAPAS